MVTVSIVSAQDADDLAIPVRKGASNKASKSDESDRSSESDKSEKSEASSSTSDADLAAVENLRPGSARSSSPDNTDEDDEEAKEEMGPSAGDIPPASAIASVALPPMAPVSQTVPARIAPNLYLPQTEPEKSGGFLSRLLGRRNNTETATAPSPAPVARAQTSFSSDYATRDGNMILPTVLDGSGWNGADLPIGGEDPYRLASLPSDFRPTDLVKLPVQSCHYGNQLYLRREAAISLMNMVNAAAAEGLTLRVVSAFRDNGHQTRLYNRAVARGGKDQKMVARPGKSEHNLGTTVDLTNNEKHALKRSFGDTPEGRWLAYNAARFGWKMTVMSGTGRRSHNDEPWHLRYLGGSLNGFSPPSTVAQQVSPPQRRDIMGSIGKFLRLRD